MSDWSSDPEPQPFVPVPPEPEAVPEPEAMSQPGPLAKPGQAASPASSTSDSATAPMQPVWAGPVHGGTSGLSGIGARWVSLALATAIAVAIGGIGFAAGRMTAPASVGGASGGRTFGGGQLPGQGANQAPGGQAPNGFSGGGSFRGDDGFGDGLRGVLGAGGLSVQGTVQSVEGGVLTLRLASGQAIQVALGSTTTYHAEAAASSSDVKTGGTVIVRLQLTRGQDSAATSPTAADVTIVP